jgi:hypothetical protein
MNISTPSSHGHPLLLANHQISLILCKRKQELNDSNRLKARTEQILSLYVLSGELMPIKQYGKTEDALLFTILSEKKF